jgi:hypothetical protein
MEVLKQSIILPVFHKRFRIAIVSNSTTKKSPFTQQIAGETYRDWLVELVKPFQTILITARPPKYQDQTLERILQETGWQPEEAYFNIYNLPPHLTKEKILLDRIFPRHGRDTPYLGIESNPRTRAMYRRYGIQSIFVEENTQWTSLPLLDTCPIANGNSMTM